MLTEKMDSAVAVVFLASTTSILASACREEVHYAHENEQFLIQVRMRTLATESKRSPMRDDVKLDDCMLPGSTGLSGALALILHNVPVITPQPTDEYSKVMGAAYLDLLIGLMEVKRSLLRQEQKLSWVNAPHLVCDGLASASYSPSSSPAIVWDVPQRKTIRSTPGFHKMYRKLAQTSVKAPTAEGLLLSAVVSSLRAPQAVLDDLIRSATAAVVV